MRMGKVEFSIAYAVDLDNPDQVDLAKDFVCEDVGAAVKYNETEGYLDIIEDPSLTEGDIHQSILEMTVGEGEND